MMRASPLLILDPESALPPYEQIAAQVRQQIASKRLLPGDRLPSVRQLARDLDVAPNTVARAYGELERGGWVTTSLRRGVMVATRPPQAAPEERAHALASAVTRLLTAAHQLDATAKEIHAEIDRQMRLSNQGIDQE